MQDEALVRPKESRDRRAMTWPARSPAERSARSAWRRSWRWTSDGRRQDGHWAASWVASWDVRRAERWCALRPVLRLAAAGEGLDDEHAAATAGAWFDARLGCRWRTGHSGGCGGSPWAGRASGSGG